MSLPPETAKVRLACEVLREKTELDERPHTPGEQRIDKIINILPIEDQAPAMTTTHEHVIVQKAVKAKISDSAVLRDDLKMLSPSGPKTLVCPPRGRAKVPVRPQWRAPPGRRKFNLPAGIKMRNPLLTIVAHQGGGLEGF
jgi:hypothetical protein